MANYIAGIDIGGTTVKFGVLEDGHNLVYKTSAQSPLGDPNAMVEQIAKMVEECPYKIERIGVGTPGTCLLPEKTVSAVNLRWTNAPLADLISKRLGIPTWVDNDAQTQLAAEWWDGACQGMSSVLYITFGTGLGGAVIINGKPWRGHRNNGGEFGHFITHGDGLLCACGLKGCYEMYASARALCRMGKRDNAQEIIDAAREGDPEMMRVFREYLHEVGIGLAGMFMIFRPEAIVLGGGISGAGDILLKTLKEELDIVCPHLSPEINPILRLAIHRNDAGIRGAAALASINL